METRSIFILTVYINCLQTVCLNREKISTNVKKIFLEISAK